MIVSVYASALHASPVVHKMAHMYPGKWLVGYDHLQVTVPDDVNMIQVWDMFTPAERQWMCDRLNEHGNFNEVHDGMLALLSVGKVLQAITKVVCSFNIFHTNRRSSYRWTASEHD